MEDEQVDVFVSVIYSAWVLFGERQEQSINSFGHSPGWPRNESEKQKLDKWQLDEEMDQSITLWGCAIDSARTVQLFATPTTSLLLSLTFFSFAVFNVIVFGF